MQTEKHPSRFEMQTNAKYELLSISAVTRHNLDWTEEADPDIDRPGVRKTLRDFNRKLWVRNYR